MVSVTPKALTVEQAVPDAWRAAHWDRAWLHLSATETAGSRAPRSLVRSGSTATPLALWTDVQRALARTSIKSASQRLSADQFHQLIRATYQLLEDEPFMFAGVVTARVENWHAGAWTLENQPRRLHARTTEFSRGLLDELGQGQSWVSDAALLVLIGIDWEYAAPHNPDLAYSHALMTCGRIGHGLLLEGQTMGMQARMTPAVKESAAAALLGLDDTRDCLYLLSIARPESH